MDALVLRHSIMEASSAAGTVAVQPRAARASVNIPGERIQHGDARTCPGCVSTPCLQSVDLENEPGDRWGRKVQRREPLQPSDAAHATGACSAAAALRPCSVCTVLQCPHASVTPSRDGRSAGLAKEWTAPCHSPLPPPVPLPF